MTVSHEYTLLRICVQLFFLQHMTNLPEMTHLVLQCLTVDQNIIKVEDQEFTYKGS